MTELPVWLRKIVGVISHHSPGAWRISKEEFFDVPWINDLKIRGNWGRLGNSSIGDWDYIGTINQSIVTVFGGAIVPGSTQVKLVNAGLVWETKETVNVA